MHLQQELVGGLLPLGAVRPPLVQLCKDLVGHGTSGCND